VTSEEREKLRKEAEARAKKYGIAFKEGKGHLTPPEGYPDDPEQYGDPVNYAYPIDKDHIRAAVAYFNHEGQREAGGYTPEEWAIIGKRIAAAASRLLGGKYEYKNGKVVRVEPAGEIYAVQAVISGEMRVEDVPLAPWANLEALKAGDPEPMEVVVEIPAGKSKRGWNYRPEALQAIVGEVMSQGLPGFLGHQKPEEVDHAFPTPVTHWVGALWKDGKAYFRGVIDKAASDLKRWIKANVVRTVSIFGVPKLQQVAGETHVVDYKPLSIDWTPLGRAGMPTAVVAIGEMDEIIGGGRKEMNWKELVAQLKTMLANKEVTLGQVVGEMGWKAQEIAGEIDANWLKEVTGAVEILGKVREVLGVTGEMDIVKVAGEARKALDEKAMAEREKLINEVIKEKVAGEIAQALVRRMLQVPEGATREQIAGEIDKLMADETVKAAIGKFHVDKPPVIGGGKETTSLRVKRQAI
jgi:hypothetical protein